MNLKPWRWGAGALIAGIGLLVACDGENLFDPSQNPFAEPRVAVSAPNGAFAGDSIPISVTATAASDVATIQVSVRGAATRDTTLTVTPARTVSAVIKIALPQILTDTIVFVSAVATDKVGNTSKPRGDTVTVVGPPAVVSVKGPDSLRAGTTASVSIRAFGSRRITQMDVSMRGALTKDTTLLVSPPVNDATQTLSITLPSAVGDTAVRLSIVVKDASGLTSSPSTVSFPLSFTAPVAVLVAPVPTTVSPGSNLDLTVHATAMRGVSKIGFTLSGAYSRDTLVSVPGGTDVTMPVSIPIPGNISGSSINVVTYVIDNSNGRSVPSTPVTIAVNNGLPSITSVTAPDSVRAGQIVDVRIVAQGVRPITQLNVRFRGATNADQVVAISPASTNVTKDVQIQLPLDVADTLLTITAVAVDQAQQLSALTSAATKIVKVADVTAPVVTATPNTATAMAGGTFLIRVNARDNVALKQVGYAVVNPAGDTVNAAPTLVTTAGLSKDTTFSFSIPITLTPRTVRVLGIAVDASNHRGYSSAATVAISDTAAPSINIIAPTDSTTVPLNDSVYVEAIVKDPTHIKSIKLYGQAVRTDPLSNTTIVSRYFQKSVTYPEFPGTPMPDSVNIKRYLLPTADTTSERVDIVVETSDSAGNISKASRSISVGGPTIRIRNPLPGQPVAPGGTLGITVYALDKSSGIDSLYLSLSGSVTATHKFTTGCQAPATACIPAGGLPSRDSIVINADELIPLAAVAGPVTISATAWNRRGIRGIATPISVNVSATASADTAKPLVAVTQTAPPRIELTDTITITVSAQDLASGIKRMGIVVTTIPGASVPAQPVFYHDTVFPASRTGVPSKDFKFTLASLGYTETNLQRLPRDMTYQVHAFAFDAAATPNCGANTTATPAAFACAAEPAVVPAPTVSGRTDYFKATGATPSSLQFSNKVVAGMSVPLPKAGSRIADVVVDNNTLRPRLYLSNFSFNRLDVLDLRTNLFDSVSVGSQPWGMFLANAPGADGLLGTADDNPDRLIVANSGGTNLSFVNLGTLREEPTERLLTPNSILFDVQKTVTNASLSYLITYHDFSDRPQFVAEDANGIFLYSTKPTGAAPDGTVRYLQPTAGVRKFESKILYTRDAVSPAIDNWAIANIDSITAGITLWDHLPGNPAAVYSATDPDINNAIAMMKTGPTVGASLVGGSDIDAYPAGKWNLDVVGLSDTTYVAASGDRKFVAFGEGATGPYASIWLWKQGPGVGLPGSLSDNFAVKDLIGNAAERVQGLALNYNGTIGGARGADAAYLFSNDVTMEGQLRLQGLFSDGVANGSGGIALHPSHTYDIAAGSNALTLGFVATGSQSIKIIDTFSFVERGEIQIKESITGQLRAALPIGGIVGPFVAGDDNFGIAPDPITGTADCNIIWAKLYGVTTSGKAVIINVRKKDVVNPTITAGVCSQ